MKNIMFKTGALCAASILAAIAMVSCTEQNLDNMPDEGEIVTPADPAGNSNLTTVQLASFAGDSSRVTYAADTRAEEDAPGTLRLIASIANPSKSDGFFTPEDGGRYMSATSIHYDASDDRYYVTYHMQGNNYNTSLETETAGAIQSFTIAGDQVTLGKGFRAAEPSTLDFDFNHIYFDNTDRRIVAVGHNVKNGNPKNTNAIIGVFNPEAGSYSYTTVKTGEKEYDANGKSLGYKDAGDANCVVRTNDVPTTQPGHEGEAYGWKIYFVATRKGMAALHADDANLFKPYLNSDSMNYFIATPGSAKYVSPTGTGSYYGLLYLSDKHTGDVEYDTKSHARIAHLSVCTSTGSGLGYLQGWNNPEGGNYPLKLDPTADILDFYDQQELPELIMPVDGKNTLTIMGGSGSERYVALGANGMYYKSYDAGEGIKRFDGRPVNCIAVDNSVYRNATRGFLYVANGSKITILNNYTLKEVASYQAPSKDADGNDIASSANFIAVVRTDADSNYYDNTSVRYVAAAYGQEGVKIFKFTPPAQ